MVELRLLVLLLEPVSSPGAATSCAVTATIPAVVGFTDSVTVPVPLLASAGSVQVVTAPAFTQVMPVLPVALMKSRLLER